MKIVILQSARNDLAAGVAFYETQGEGLGEYFRESLISDVDSLERYAGITKRYSDITVCYPADFPTRFITQRIKRESS